MSVVKKGTINIPLKLGKTSFTLTELGDFDGKVKSLKKWKEKLSSKVLSVSLHKALNSFFKEKIVFSFYFCLSTLGLGEGDIIGRRKDRVPNTGYLYTIQNTWINIFLAEIFLSNDILKQDWIALKSKPIDLFAVVIAVL